MSLQFVFRFCQILHLLVEHKLLYLKWWRLEHLVWLYTCCTCYFLNKYFVTSFAIAFTKLTHHGHIVYGNSVIQFVVESSPNSSTEAEYYMIHKYFILKIDQVFQASG